MGRNVMHVHAGDWFRNRADGMNDTVIPDSWDRHEVPSSPLRRGKFESVPIFLALSHDNMLSFTQR